MKRQIIHIDEEKCNGCGACVTACHEGAIAMVDGKAKLIRDDYCDGMGDCLPECPTGAITFEEREAAAYDENAVAAHKASRAALHARQEECSGERSFHRAGGCPGSASRTFDRDAVSPLHVHRQTACPGSALRSFNREGADASPSPSFQAMPVPSSQLRQWPVQIKLAPLRAPYFDGAHLLIAADCTAYAYGNFHNDFIKGKTTLIGCPKLDEGDYTEKLAAIIGENNIKSLTVVRMEVPCCGGIENAAVNALKASGKFIPWQVVTVSCDGRILDE